MTPYSHRSCLMLFLACLSAASYGFAEEPQFLQHTPNDRSVVVYVADPLPHLIRTAQSPGFQRVVTEMFQGPLGAVDTSTWVPTLEDSVAPYLPTEIAFSLNHGAIDDLSRLFRIALHVGLCNGALEAEQADDFKKIQQVLTEEFGQIQLRGLDVWINFRTPLPAALAFGQANTLAAQMFDVDGVEITHAGQSIRLQSQLGKIYDEETLLFFLAEFGVVADLESPGSVALAQAVGQLNIDVSFRMVGNAVQLRVGDAGEFEPLSGESLGELWNSDASTLFFASYQMQSFLDQIRQTVGEWDKWAATPTGQATADLDTEDLLGDLKNIVRMVGQSSLDGATRLQWKDDLTLSLHEYRVPEADALNERPIVRWIPDTGDIVSATTTFSIADQWNNQLTQFEDRLATNSMKYEMTGRTQQAEMTEQMTQFYYQQMKEFRRLVKEESYSVFRPPTVTLADGRGTISRLSAAFSLGDEPSAIAMNNLTVPRMAVIGRLQPNADPDQLLQQIWGSFLQAVLSEEMAGVELVHDVDYGLDRPTRAFGGEWQQDLPNDVRITLEGDMRPHYFTLPDGLFVFSSSSELSRAIVAAGGDAAQRLEIPAADERLVSFGLMPGISMAQMSGSLTSLLDYVMDEESDLELEGETLQAGRSVLAADQAFYTSIRSLFSSLTLACASVDTIRWTTTQQGDRRVTSGVMSFNTP